MRSNMEIHNEVLKLENLIKDIKNIDHPADIATRFYAQTQINYLNRCIAYNAVISIDQVNFGSRWDVEFVRGYVKSAYEWVSETPRVEAPSIVWNLMISHGYIGPNKENFLQKARQIS